MRLAEVSEGVAAEARDHGRELTEGAGRELTEPLRNQLGLLEHQLRAADGWHRLRAPRVPLKELIAFARNGLWGQAEAELGLVQMRVIRGIDFERVHRGDLSTVQTRFVAPRVAARKSLQPGDVLIEVVSGSRDRPPGRTMLIGAQHLASFGAPATCSGSVRFLQVDSSKVAPEYLFWLMQSLHASGEMEKFGSTRAGVLRFERFTESTWVPLPALDEQRVMAGTLRALEDTIELSRHARERLVAALVPRDGGKPNVAPIRACT